MDVYHYPTAFHFSLADRCQFQVGSIIDYKYVVSTVGELPAIFPSQGYAWESFSSVDGSDQLYYETMTFKAKGKCRCAMDNCYHPYIPKRMELYMERSNNHKDIIIFHKVMVDHYIMKLSNTRKYKGCSVEHHYFDNVVDYLGVKPVTYFNTGALL
jgi:hypothetical protein